jgi:hypothetical protein
VFVLHVEGHNAVLYCINREKILLFSDPFNHVFRVFLQFLNGVTNLQGTVVHEGIVYLKGVVASPQTYDPILIVHDIVVVRKMVSVE